MIVAQLQTQVDADRAADLANLRKLVNEAAACGADLVTAGEMFACPYDTKNFPAYAEPRGGKTYLELADIAASAGVYLSAGTVPELGTGEEAGRVYNTAYVFGRDGALLAAHRKMHLFDIDVKGGQRFKESETLSAGNEVTVFDTEFGRMGVEICFDARFPELTRLMVLKGARVVLVPAAFNMTTGPAHWQVMFRSRAVDNQCFMIGTSVARDEDFSYVAWGHSIIVDPWGTVVSEMDGKPGVRITDLNLGRVDKIREQLPLLSAMRNDIYELKETGR